MKFSKILQEMGKLEYGKDSKYSATSDSAREKIILSNIKKAIDYTGKDGEASEKLRTMLGKEFKKPYDIEMEIKGPVIEIKISPEDGTKPYLINVPLQSFMETDINNPITIAQILTKNYKFNK